MQTIINAALAYAKKIWLIAAPAKSKAKLFCYVINLSQFRDRTTVKQKRNNFFTWGFAMVFMKKINTISS